jgi:periplasmic protein TonB
MQFHSQDESVGPARYRNVSGILLAFGLLSLLVHGGTLLFYTEATPPLTDQRFGTTVISTILKTADKYPTPPPQVSETPPAANKPLTKKAAPAKIISTNNSLAEHRPTAIRKTETELALRKNPVQTRHVSTPKISATRAPEANKAILASQREQQRNYLLGELQTRLSKHLTYPNRARRRGWQGNVMLGLHIDENGQFNNVRLIHSSGYSLLDNSALSAIAKLGFISRSDTLGAAQAMDLQLPVRYRLQES